MTQEELDRLDGAHRLNVDIDILRKASLIVSNSPMSRAMSDNEKQHIFYTALELVKERLADLFADEARRLELKFQVL